MECGVTDNSPSESCVTSDVQTTAAQYADSCTVVRVAGTQTIPLEGSNNGNSITMSFVKFSVCKPRTKSNDNCYPCNDNMAVVVDAEMSTSKIVSVSAELPTNVMRVIAAALIITLR